MTNSHQVKMITLIAAFTSILYGEQPTADTKFQDPHEMCIPATYLPGSRMAQIHKKLLGSTVFEFVIFVTGTRDSYPATIVHKTQNGYQCDLRNIKGSDLINADGNFDEALIEKSTVHIISRIIDKSTVETLRITLLNQVKKAHYPTEEKEATLKEPFLGGSNRTV